MATQGLKPAQYVKAVHDLQARKAALQEHDWVSTSLPMFNIRFSESQEAKTALFAQLVLGRLSGLPVHATPEEHLAAVRITWDIKGDKVVPSTIANRKNLVKEVDRYIREVVTLAEESVALISLKAKEQLKPVVKPNAPVRDDRSITSSPFDREYETEWPQGRRGITITTTPAENADPHKPDAPFLVSDESTYARILTTGEVVVNIDAVLREIDERLRDHSINGFDPDVLAWDLVLLRMKAEDDAKDSFSYKLTIEELMDLTVTLTKHCVDKLPPIRQKLFLSSLEVEMNSETRHGDQLPFLRVHEQLSGMMNNSRLR